MPSQAPRGANASAASVVNRGGEAPRTSRAAVPREQLQWLAARGGRCRSSTARLVAGRCAKPVTHSSTESNTPAPSLGEPVHARSRNFSVAIDTDALPAGRGRSGKDRKSPISDLFAHSRSRWTSWNIWSAKSKHDFSEASFSGFDRRMTGGILKPTSFSTLLERCLSPHELVAELVSDVDEPYRQGRVVVRPAGNAAFDVQL